MSAHVPDPRDCYDASTLQAPAANTDGTYHDLFSALRALLVCYQLPLPRLEALLDALDADPRPIERLTVGELLGLIGRVRA